jgi:BlaI family transcriptional regulator, penicillinase repressor
MADHSPEEPSFTDRELEVMSVLWRAGSGTVAEVRAALGRPVGYTTVLKVLQVLETKGHVSHEAEGRAYRYFPTVAREEAGESALGRVVDRIFGGSTSLALMHLVESRKPSEHELDRMKQILEELEAERDSSGGER